jgi:hypothetical protein
MFSIEVLKKYNENAADKEHQHYTEKSSEFIESAVDILSIATKTCEKFPTAENFAATIGIVSILGEFVDRTPLSEDIQNFIGAEIKRFLDLHARWLAGELEPYTGNEEGEKDDK